MILYPAIDLLDGEVVRLVEGNFDKKTVFKYDPKNLLSTFAKNGATHVHLVDLSGARDPAARQIDLIQDLVHDVELKVQVGGGIRSLKEIEVLLNAGADRVVLGSLIIKSPELAKTALKEFPGKITFALDVRVENNIPVVMTDGWQKSSALSFHEVFNCFAEYGLKRILCTDVSVDGKAVGPSVELYSNLISTFPALELQASGGVTKLSDLTDLKNISLHSVVIGRAILSGEISLTEALNYA